MLHSASTRRGNQGTGLRSWASVITSCRLHIASHRIVSHRTHQNDVRKVTRAPASVRESFHSDAGAGAGVVATARRGEQPAKDQGTHKHILLEACRQGATHTFISSHDHLKQVADVAMSWEAGGTEGPEKTRYLEVRREAVRISSS
jgi:hypothetical protein